MTDIGNYHEWNPYHVYVNGQLNVGEKLEVKIYKPNGATVEIDPHIIRLDPIRELTWGGGIRGIFYGEHIFVIEEINTNQTRLIHKEDFTGFTVPFASLDSIKEGYELMNEALKTRAELSNKLAIE